MTRCALTAVQPKMPKRKAHWLKRLVRRGQRKMNMPHGCNISMASLSTGTPAGATLVGGCVIIGNRQTNKLSLNYSTPEIFDESVLYWGRTKTHSF